MKSDIELLDEILRLKNQIIRLEMRENEIKAKVQELSRTLGRDRPRAAKSWDEIKAWANEKS